MKNKIKLKDKLKSWLYTLGVASFACALGVCVSLSEKYQKASAYDYQENGTLSFNLLDDGSVFDCTIFGDYLFQFIDNDIPLYFDIYNGSTLLSSVNPDNDNFDWTDNSLDIGLSDESNFHVDKFPYNFYGFIFDNGTSYTDFYVRVNPSYRGYQNLRNYVLSYNASQSSGNFVTALTSFMSLIGGGIVDLAQTIGASVVSFASGLFLDSGHLSILGGIIGIFAGIALAVGITSKVYTWVSTLGN